MKQALNKVLAIILIITASGCTTIRYQSIPLPLEERPRLPAMNSQELMCLSDDAYKKMYLRESLLKEHRDKLEAVIKRTHKKVE